MTLFDKIKILMTLNKTVETMEKENQMDSKSGKPGYQTTEFWMTLLTVVIPALITSLNGIIPPKYGLMITAGASAAYGIIRVIAKAVADWHDIQSQTLAAAPLAPLVSPGSTAVSVDVATSPPSK